ncbi:RNA polymerase sigma factor ShbA [Nocardia sp. NEAU-G5]|uniref:RNA polymerase sigma factor ShbA n=1 Tax=Nocardia albiluteola TaxID=2842303 RepID=A0ABS6B5Q8_9NOCA|nr:RNA polymerase sigma factor ShbA [Nocardia albiluteola]MBU3062577.1 RNA polymerase sigma factor ShbA [Nocardia albiluteola]MBU3065589.1 RNA polymerase sigma factor ShbA [Nocardia albiluteola]
MALLENDLAGAVRGERTAIARVLAEIRPQIVHYCRARVNHISGSTVSADDVAQEVCIAVLRALPRYRDEGRPFMAFVYGIAAHKVADAYRSAARNRIIPVEAVPDLPCDDTGPEQRALQSEAARRMSDLLGALPPKQREILILRVAVGLSAAETAAAVGGTAGSIRVAQHRAMTKLRALAVVRASAIA